MQYIFLNRFFHPDQSATSQMLSDAAFSLAERGLRITVITSRQRYDAREERLPARDVTRGVSVLRVWTSGFGRGSLFGRFLDYTTFYLTSVWRLWRVARPGDVVIAKTDPPMLSIIAAPVCRLRRARLVNWLQDMFPETAQVLNGGRATTALCGGLQWLRDRSLRGADVNVVLGGRMADRLLELGVAPARIRQIPNWADGDVIVPLRHEVNALRQQWSLGDAFVVAYSGNLGRAHEIDTFVEAMSILGRSSKIVWLFIGGGARMGTLKEEAARRGLRSVRFKPYQSREALAQSLSVADVHLISLQPRLEGLVVPSKFYGIAAAGRPSIFVGDGDGEVARLVKQHRCGYAITSGDGAALARAIVDLASDPAACRQMGERARQAFGTEFDRCLGVARWEELLLEVSAAQPGTLASAAQVVTDGAR